MSSASGPTLRALIETSPVGVAVFNAQTGAPVSINREAMRMVDGLREPDQSLEQLLGVVTCRRADGQEISLMELSMSELLSAGERVRAEEIVLRVPDGRSVATLLNATPVHSENGGGGDLRRDYAGHDPTGRCRADEGRVPSHGEPRVEDAPDFDQGLCIHPAGARLFTPIPPRCASSSRSSSSRQSGCAHSSQTSSTWLALRRAHYRSPLSRRTLAVLAGEAVNAFRVGGNRHDLRIDIPPDMPWVMADRSRIVQVLGNLLANAARHSPEPSTIRVSAEPGDLHVSVSVSDDGRGHPR